MPKNFIIILAVIFLFVQPAIAKDTDSDKMENELGRGYLAASKNDIDGALGNFTKSLEYAKKCSSWKGFVDAGNAFSALGRPEDAAGPFNEARALASSQKDWRGLVSVAYGYMVLPEKLGPKKNASSSLAKALPLTLAAKDWRGLIEIAKIYSNIGEKQAAKKALTSAKELVKGTSSEMAALTLGETAKELGFPDINKECVDMAKKFGGSGKPTAPPPPGWTPYGESIAGPDKVSVETQKAMLASADSDIKSKREYLAAIEKKDKKDQQYYTAFRNYYDYPGYSRFYGTGFGLGFGFWRPLTPVQVSGWANQCLGNYRYQDDAYVYAY